MEVLARIQPLVAAFTDTSDETGRIEQLAALRAATDEAYGADAAALAAAIRERDGTIAAIVALLDASSSLAQQMALSFIGNLLNEQFDARARETLTLFVGCGGLAALQAQLYAPQPVSLFACAVLQNLTSLDPHTACATLREQGCEDALAPLFSSADASVSSYATAVLANLRATDPAPPTDDALEEAMRMRRLTSIVYQLQRGRAIALVQGAARQWVIRYREGKQQALAERRVASDTGSGTRSEEGGVVASI